MNASAPSAVCSRASSGMGRSGGPRGGRLALDSAAVVDVAGSVSFAVSPSEQPLSTATPAATAAATRTSRIRRPPEAPAQKVLRDYAGQRHTRVPRTPYLWTLRLSD